MDIEKDIFIRYKVNYSKLLDYGFSKDNNDNYSYEKEFLNEFKAIIKIDDKGKVVGNVIDLNTGFEYTNIRTNNDGEFVGLVRDEYKKILIDIRNQCFIGEYFKSLQARRITKYIFNKYKVKPEFLWDKTPDCGVFRNVNNNKWFGIIMNINRSKINEGDGEVEIINIKLEANTILKLLKKKGYYPAYHMNKNSWISIILDDTLSDLEILSLIDNSYSLVAEKLEWIIPANPKYYDIVNCFNDSDEIIWKQSSKIFVNDIVYIYVAAPYSKILYKCKVLEANIPYEYQGDNISMKYVMRIKLLKRLDNKNYTFEYLNKLGIKAIRGPRKISTEVSAKLK